MFCAELLWAFEADEQGDSPGPTTDYCQTDPSPHCVDLCGGATPYGTFTSEEPVGTVPACQALTDCCAKVGAPGGSAACGLIATQGSFAYCTSALKNFQQLGFCE